MTSVSERLAKYRAAAEDTARFGDLETSPPEREWVTKSPSTNAILSKAQEYEKSVQILRADQDTPGVLENFHSGNAVLHVEEEQVADVSIKSPQTSNQILQRTKEYEKSVKILRADQDKPGIAEKLIRSNTSQLLIDDHSSGTSNNSTIEKHSSFNKSSNHSITDQVPYSSSEEPEPVMVVENNTDIFDEIAEKDENNLSVHSPTTSHGAATSNSTNSTHTRNSGSDEYTVEQLPTGDPRLSGGSSNKTTENPIPTSNDSIPRYDTVYTGEDDEFDAISTESVEEGHVELEELLDGDEFTNDAVPVEEEESIPVRQYYEAKHQSSMPDRAPTLASLPRSSSTNSSEISSVDFNVVRLPERGADRPTSVQRRPIRHVQRADTGRPEFIQDDEPASEAEDEGVRLGWSRQHSDRLPKAKVMMIARRKSVGGSASTLDHHDSDHDDVTSGAPSTLPNRRLVKQYKDREEYLAGRVSRVDQTRASRIDQTRASRLAIEREERAKRHAAGVARRSSLVANTIDRVSMAADPFIEFMDTKGTSGPRKPRGTLGKIWHKLFRRKNKREKLLKSG